MSKKERTQVRAGSGNGNKGPFARGFESNKSEKKIEHIEEGESEQSRLIFALLELSGTLRRRFDRYGHLEDIKNAIRCQWLALHLVPETDSSTKGLVLSCLGDSYTGRFHFLGEIRDINKAIECRDRAVLLVAGDQETEAGIFNNLGNSYRFRFERSGDAADVANAIECHTKAVQLTPNVLAQRPGYLDNLGTSYVFRFDRHGDAADLDSAIEHYMQALQLTTGGDANKSSRLSNLGNAYKRRFERHGDVADMNKSIECHTQAVRLTSDASALMPRWFNNLGNSYICRFQRFEDVADLERSIECHMKAVQLTPDAHTIKPTRLNNLGGSYSQRFGRNGNVADLDDAIKCFLQAVQLAPHDHSIQPTLLDNLGNSYRDRFERRGDVEDIEKSVTCHTQAIQLTPDGHAVKPHLLGGLGHTYLCRFERRGDIADLNKSIECHMQALQLTPDDDHASRSDRFRSLGGSYRSRFERHGDVADIDKSIAYHMQALQLTPDGDASKSSRLSGLGDSYRFRFERHGDVADIDKSIECHVQAVQLTPEDHAERPIKLRNLGISRLRRFECNGDILDVDKAVECLTQAVQLTPENHAHKPSQLATLGDSYLQRFNQLGDAADINHSVRYNLEAVQLTTEGHPEKPYLLNALGNSYRCRFQRYEDVTDIEEAIKWHLQAVQLIPEGHADGPSWLSNLGQAYVARFTQSSQLIDLETASTCFKRAAESMAGSAHTRFTASCAWARCSSRLGVSPMLAYHQTIELVRHLVWLGTTIEQRYDLLREIGDIAMEASSAAISLNAYDLALEWLEQGRSVVWNQILQLRTPFDDLHAVDPALAKRLKEVAQSLERAGSVQAACLLTKNIFDPEADAQRHRRLATEWDRLLQQAREVPSFQDVIRPRKAVELMRAAKDGPLIVINIHQTRCDALIILPDSDNMAHVPLADFSLEKANEFHVRFVGLIGHRGGRDRGFQRAMPADKPFKFKAMLSALWSDVVKPIFDFLGYTSQQLGEQLPHITWCTTGSLSFLPLHAAGCYDGSQPNAPDLAVSSYTPTLSALLAPNSSASIQSSGIVAVGQQYTKGHCDLPCTMQELAAIQEHAAGVDYLQLDDTNATVNAVLNAMEEHSWVHLACHAAQHQDPARSAFLLHDGDLMLSTITRRSFKNKGLAFLSACQTATGDEKIPDEAVHLAAGMLMAGYPSVIATMWSIRDEDAPEVARQVYADLLRDGRMDYTKTARALHKAVVGLSERVGEGSFERWMPFIHIGR